uniref:Rieske domain-containing protein n=1 Tax=Alexandrium catenella TaxID=2925 RepID=A0A7S1M9Z2_ALECA|mmetsp:Transcript_22724/g.62011  ORF Transcript_22724/g.62011 Transcript_22724/m.62011 type:complete len:485 (+) Transcript_22724:61-1515(+)
MQSATPSIVGLSGMALASASLLQPAAAFVAPPSLQAVAGAAPAQAERPEQRSEFGASAGLATAACALAVAGGATRLLRRRSATASRVLNQPIPVVNWQVDPKTPVPGSEKALQTMVGTDVEMGEEPWDPMGFSKLYDRNFDFNMVMTYPHVQWLREAEVKHGRVCMLAFVGAIVQQFAHIPGLPVEADWTKALGACYADKTAALGIVQISVFAMVVEGRYYSGDAWIGQMDREPGDLGFDPLKLSKRPGFDLKKLQLQEIKNGRLAMIGVASLAANHSIPGSVPMLSGLYAQQPEACREAAAPAFCGATRPTLTGPVAEALAPTAARYTTKKVLPAFQWLKTGIKASQLAPGQLVAKTLGGNDVLVGKDQSGTLFCVGNLCPHFGTPMSEGADVIGDIIVCPLHGSSFSVKTGELLDWCPSPPIIGPLTGIIAEQRNLPVLEARTSFFGDDIEVNVDTNAKKAYEADYWKGLLDAQGKVDGTYY